MGSAEFCAVFILPAAVVELALGGGLVVFTGITD